MHLLIVNTLPKDDPYAASAISVLRDAVPDSRVIYAFEMNIRPCTGCNFCWLRAPGICSVKDGYDELLKAYLSCDAAVFIAETALNFVDHRMKNVIDRLLPLATMYTTVSNGQCRHVMRYDKKLRFGLLYTGSADRGYLREWMERVMINLGGESLGVFPVCDAKEVISCI